MTRILTILRTPGAMLAALVLALLAQLEHTAQVFSMVVGASGIYAQVHAYAFAVAVETAVLLFVLAGHKWISYGFALATAATNLSYYAMNGINLFSVAALPAWLMSLLLPAAIVGYSHTIAEQGADTHPTHPETPVALPSAISGHSEYTTTEDTNHDGRRTEQAGDPTPVQFARQDGGYATQDGSASAPQVTPQPPVRKIRKARRKTAKASPEQRRAQIVSSGMDDASAIAAAFHVSVRTAQADLESIRKATMAQNGASHG